MIAYFFEREDKEKSGGKQAQKRKRPKKAKFSITPQPVRNVSSLFAKRKNAGSASFAIGKTDNVPSCFFYLIFSFYFCSCYKGYSL